MALTYVEHPISGAGPYSFSTLEFLPLDVVALASQINVYVDGVLVDPVDYTVDDGLYEITFDSAPSGTTTRIARTTNQSERLVPFNNGSNIPGSLLNLNMDQLFFLIQEIIDTTLDSLVKDTDGIWNAQSIRLKNLAEGTESTDAVNLGQLQAVAAGLNPMNVAGQGYYTATGDGLTDTYTLPTGSPVGKAASDYNVYFNGVKQQPTSSYTIDSSGSTDAIVFSADVPSGYLIDVFWTTGTVAGSVTDGSIDNAAVADDAAIEVSKLDAGTNGQALLTTAGVPTWTTLAASNISDFESSVLALEWTDMALPTSNPDMNSHRVKNVATPTQSGDAANKAYVDGLIKQQQLTISTYSGSAITINTSFTIGAYVAFITGTGTGADNKSVCGAFNGNEAHAHGSGPTVTRTASSTITFSSNPSGTVRVMLFEA